MINIGWGLSLGCHLTKHWVPNADNRGESKRRVLTNGKISLVQDTFVHVRRKASVSFWGFSSITDCIFHHHVMEGRINRE